MNELLRLAFAILLAAGFALLVTDFVVDFFNARLDKRRHQFDLWLKRMMASQNPVDRAEAIAAKNQLNRNPNSFDYRGPWERKQ